MHNAKSHSISIGIYMQRLHRHIRRVSESLGSSLRDSSADSVDIVKCPQTVVQRVTPVKTSKLFNFHHIHNPPYSHLDVEQAGWVGASTKRGSVQRTLRPPNVDVPVVSR